MAAVRWHGALSEHLVRYRFHGNQYGAAEVTEGLPLYGHQPLPGRCVHAVTYAGHMGEWGQCAKRPLAGSDYCWQHDPVELARQGGELRRKR